MHINKLKLTLTLTNSLIIMKRKYCTSTMLPFCMALLFSVFMLQSGFAQQRPLSVSGKITSTEDGMGIPGASVVVEGANSSTTTDFDGNYKINVKSDAVLKFSFVGYTTQRVSVNNRTSINVAMQIESADLKEVVVIGYGTQKKKVSTASTSIVSGKDIQSVASLDVLNALQGQAAGVNITSSSGQPGAAMKIEIRGAGTIGNRDPLYVVDGVPIDNGIGYLDASVIERVDVLKDASAASIYGARAANGVVLVTTKKGKEGKINVSFDSYTGIQRVAKRLDLLNTQEYTYLTDEGRVNSGLAPLYPSAVVAGLPNHDWQSDMFKDGAIKQNHSVMITAGDKRSSIATGFSYYGQEGLIGSSLANQSNYRRLTFTVNSATDVIADRLKIGENFSFANINSRGIADGGIYGNSVQGFLHAAPIDVPYNADGSFAHSIISVARVNPLAALYYSNFNETITNRYVANIYAELKLIQGLTFKTSFGVDVSDSGNRSYNPIYTLSSNNINTVSSVTQNSNNGIGWSFENTLNYKFNIKDIHHFDVLIGTSAKEKKSEYLSGKGFYLKRDGFQYAYLSNTVYGGTAASAPVISGSPYTYTSLSSFGRLFYDYNNKYLLSASVRRDGSSEFGPNNKYAIFPAASLGWNVDKESFFPQNNVLNTLKLRASWGQNGNDQFSKQFAYSSTVSTYDKSYQFGNGAIQSLTPGGVSDSSSNPDLKWETSEQIDYGFDARLFNGLDVVFDYYNKTTKDWLVQPPVTETTGLAAPFVNGGDVRNRGVELGLNYKGNVGKNWTYGISANISHNQNEVTRIANAEGIIHGDGGILSPSIDELNRVQVGQPMGYFYGLKTAGIFQTQAEIDAYAVNGVKIQPNAQPGDVKFVDLNGVDPITGKLTGKPDGKIDLSDKTKIGDPNPKYTFGLNFEVAYKAFDLALYSYGVSGNQNVFALQGYTTAILNRWTGPGTSNTIPRVTALSDTNGNYTHFSDLYLQDGSFYRIKNITIGCDIAKLMNKPMAFSKLRFYVSANNLFTFTKYQGMDPEVGYGYAGWGKGIDVGSYPQPRVYTIGLNANF